MKKVRTRIVCLNLILALAGYATANASLSTEEIYEKAVTSVLTLKVENGQKEKFVGTGFVVLRPGLAVTAWHVVHDAKKIEAYFPGNQTVKVLGLVAKDESRDLAFLEIEDHDRAALPLAFSQPRIGAKIYAIGSPHCLDFTISDGLVSQVREVDGFCQYQLSCPISPGNSGGPVINDIGEVLGVVSWRKPKTQNISFAIPSFEVARMGSFQSNQPGLIGEIITKGRRPQSEQVLVRDADQGQLLEFQRAWAVHAGKQITLTLDDGFSRQEFTLTAPLKSMEVK